MNRKIKINTPNAIYRYRYGHGQSSQKGNSNENQYTPSPAINNSRHQSYLNKNTSVSSVNDSNSSIDRYCQINRNVIDNQMTINEKEIKVSFEELNTAFGRLISNKANLLSFFHDKQLSQFIYQSIFKYHKFSDIKCKKTLKDYQQIVDTQKELGYLEELKLKNPELNGELLVNFNNYLNNNIIQKYQIMSNWKEGSGIYSYLTKDLHHRVLIITLFKDMKNIKSLEVMERDEEEEDYKVIKIEDNSKGNKNKELDKMLKEFVRDIIINSL